MPTDGSLRTDDEGLQQLLRACRCYTFNDMYDQVMNSTPNTPREVGTTEVQTQTSSPRRVEAGSPASNIQPFRENPAANNSSIKESSATSDFDYDDLLNFQSDSSPQPIRDIDIDELIEMFGFDDPSGQDDNTTLLGGDNASKDDACAYPTPTTTVSTVTRLGPLNVGR